MIILHAGLQACQLLLWGEAAPEPGPIAPKPRKTIRSTVGISPLPNGTSAESLQAATTLVAIDVPTTPLKAQTAIAWLPTVAGKPVPSNPLLGEPPAATEKVSLSAWKITALRLPPPLMSDLLGACIGKDTLMPGVVIGADLAYWSMAFRFAAALVTTQRFLPGVDLNGQSPRGRWEPVIAGSDTQRFARLVAAMPDACRALSALPGKNEAPAQPATPASALLSEFLAEMVDYLVRSATTTVDLARIATMVSRGRWEGFESVHDRWVYSLSSPHGELTAKEPELAKLVEEIREWQRPLAVSRTTPFRLCFRLEEPPFDEADEVKPAPATRGRKKKPAPAPSWYIRYLVQASDDPSLLIPVEKAWTATGQRAKLLKRGTFDPREYLLSALGQAARISPQVEQSLKSTAPAGYEVDANGALEFLSDKAWQLEEAGFGVLLPAWWTRKGTKTRLSARAKVKSPKMVGGGKLSLEQIVKFEWEVALGDQKLTLRELEALARLKAPLVRLRGQWVQLDAGEIQTALEFWKKQTTTKARVRDVVKMALGAAKAPGGIDFSGVEATGWVGDMLATLGGNSQVEELASPKNLRATLRPYQTRGYSWLDFLHRLGLGACLADDMGLGKTVQALALIQRDWELNGRRPTLLVCPMSIVGNWQKEAERFTPDLPVMVHHGAARRKGKEFQRTVAKHGLILSSYALLYRDFDLLKEVNWNGIILDEAQNIKNAQTKQAQAARALPAEYRIALTGTPVENNVGDLWSLMEFLNPGFLGNQTEFKRNFFVPIQAGNDPEAAQRLKQLTGPFILRRLKTDRSIIADLPEKMEMKVFCTLTREQASLYAAVVDDAQNALDKTSGIRRKGVVLATLSKLKQVCNHPAQFLGDNSAIPGRSGKLSRLTEMMEEILAANERALVFTQFAEMGAIIQRHLQGVYGKEALFLHGATPKKQRDRMVERFQSDKGGPPVFVLSLKAGGTGLNLTAATHVFHFDRWWNPAVENQATDRAFRIGQLKNVQVHKFLCSGTLEEKIDEMIEHKQALAARIVGTGEGWLTELSTDALKELFALRQDAVGE